MILPQDGYMYAHCQFRNVAFATFLAHIIWFRAQFSNYSIKTTHLDIASEFASKAFNDYCISIVIIVE